MSKSNIQKRLNNILYSFPVQLLFLHLKKSILLLSLWFIITFFFTGGIGRSLGIQYLFLEPEYLGEVGFWSFGILGFTFGAFLTAWNISSYLLHSMKFPFLASLHRPLLKFSINNTLVPFLFTSIYFYYIIRFQLENDYASSKIGLTVLGFFIGLTMALFLFAIYFKLTNKDIYSYEAKKRYKRPRAIRGMVVQRDKRQDKDVILQRKWRVDSYLNNRLRPKYVRSVAHYKPEILKKVFNQQHNNASILQLVSILFLVALGFLMNYPVFQIPAGASIFILFTIATSLLGAMWYWLRSWHVVVLIALLFLIDGFSKNASNQYANKAYGLNYDTVKAAYNNDNLDVLYTQETIEADKKATIEILNNWKDKNDGIADTIKPKMIMIGVSGGGLRSAVWSSRVLQYVDSTLNGQLLHKTVLMTGASGGMLGAAYMRELRLPHKREKSFQLYNEKWIDNISKDLLNPVAFSIAVNDIFIPWSYFDFEGYQYPIDRGYIFENQFIQNTEYFNDAQLKDYAQLEQAAEIPLMFITPVIVNDARRLIISAQPVSYMTRPPLDLNTSNQIEYDGIDFGRLFAAQGAYDLRFTTALRMNATYPYILPNVHLPSVPEIEISDAGWRDNNGLDTPARFTHVFKDWIKENTSGVVFIQIRGSEKIDSLPVQQQGFIQRLINPLGFVGNFMQLQDFQQDASLGYLQDILGEDMVNLVQFTYRPSLSNQRASMSFHLTAKEKHDIIQAITAIEENQESLKLLQILLE